MPIDKTDPTMRALAARLGDRKATAVALCTNVINMRGTLALRRVLRSVRERRA